MKGATITAEKYAKSAVGHYESALFWRDEAGNSEKVRESALLSIAAGILALVQGAGEKGEDG